MPVREQWIALLSKLVSPSSPADAAAGLVAMLPMLGDLPDGAFTLKSLEYVARQCRRTPSYAELRSSLSAWWADNRPASSMPALAAPESDGTAEFWCRRATAMQREWDDPAGIRERVAFCAGDERYLVLLRALVARHAPQHSWIVPPSPAHHLEVAE
jgi:hypothetical protein